MRLRSIFCLRLFAILFLMAACVPSLAAQPSLLGPSHATGPASKEWWTNI